MIDATDALRPLFAAFWWVIPLMILAAVTKTAWFKGWMGEWLVNLVAGMALPSKSYARFRNVTLNTPDSTTQIDHVIVSVYGVFCIETKNMSGWIFGREGDRQWTQKIYRKSYRFQNPLRQNYKHVRALEELLGLPRDTVHSVVVFAGRATFKTDMPENVTHALGFPRYVKSHRQAVFPDTDVAGFCEIIESSRLAPTWRTHRAHVRNVKKRVTARKTGGWAPKGRN